MAARSMADGLSAREKQFIDAGKLEPTEPPIVKTATRRKARPKPQIASKATVALKVPVSPKPRSELPASDEAEPLESLTVRIPRSLNTALRRHAAYRSIDRVEPHTQQAIVAAALQKWMDESGDRV